MDDEDAEEEEEAEEESEVEKEEEEEEDEDELGVAESAEDAGRADAGMAESRTNRADQ